MTTTSDKRKRDEGVEHHDQVPSPEVFEAAKRGALVAIHLFRVGQTVDDVADRIARHVLDAALPVVLHEITEGIAEAIEAVQVNADPADYEESNFAAGCIDGLSDAATIALAYGKATS